MVPFLTHILKCVSSVRGYIDEEDTRAFVVTEVNSAIPIQSLSLVFVNGAISGLLTVLMIQTGQCRLFFSTGYRCMKDSKNPHIYTYPEDIKIFYYIIDWSAGLPRASWFCQRHPHARTFELCTKKVEYSCDGGVTANHFRILKCYNFHQNVGPIKITDKPVSKSKNM